MATASLALFPSLRAATSSQLIIILIISIISSHYYCRAQKKDSNYYDLCAPLRCGNINFSFPFSSLKQFGTGSMDCGLPQYTISCDRSGSMEVATLQLAGKSYQVKGLYSLEDERAITVSDNQLISDLRSGTCSSLRNLSFSTDEISENIGFLGFVPRNFNLTFFECPKRPLALPAAFLEETSNYSCSSEDSVLYLAKPEPQVLPGRGIINASQTTPVNIPPAAGCTVVTYPASVSSLLNHSLVNHSQTTPVKIELGLLLNVLRDGFPLQWPDFENCTACSKAGGRCGYNGDSRKIECFCKGGCASRCGYNGDSRKIECFCGCSSNDKDKNSRGKALKLVVGITTGAVFLLLTLALLVIFKFKRRILHLFSASHFKRKGRQVMEQNVEQFIQNYKSSLPRMYSYNDIKKMTNGFKEKLGAGGYGNVFKGKLPDGRLFAAKMLQKSNDINGQDFINEVATIGRIHHVNIIRLLGFCWEDEKQLLIYEFMPNGSLGDLIRKEAVSHSLGWERLLEIALQVAYGIEYLHHGCESRILHLDIKPHNVLLDGKFNPKISDFGLAKTYSRNHSAVPLTGARGTVGYIAPEVFLRSLGNASNKSDVYSYGMLLLEMVGAKKKVVVQGDQNSSKVYFPGWIYDKLIQEEDMELIDDIREEDTHIAKKMVMVGLWCIQINPKDRPSMTRVVDMLCGSVEAIEMPPKSLLFSPPRVQNKHDPSPANSETSTLFFTFESS